MSEPTAEEIETIKQEVRERANGHCENCGCEHLAIGIRHINGEFIPKPQEEWHSEVTLKSGTYRTIRIVCGVTKIEPRHPYAVDNLRYLCQQCRMRLTARSRANKATRTRRNKNPQMDLVDWIEDRAAAERNDNGRA